MFTHAHRGSLKSKVSAEFTTTYTEASERANRNNQTTVRGKYIIPTHNTQAEK